jgi:hypothetical protein
MPAPWLRRSTNSGAGFSAGGGDTGFAVQPQPTIFSVILTGTETKEVVLPKGTRILAGLNIPLPPGAGDDFDMATAGDIEIGLTDGGSEYLTSTAAETYTDTAVSGAPVLTADTRVYFSAVAVEGVTMGALRVILPRTRP